MRKTRMSAAAISILFVASGTGALLATERSHAPSIDLHVASSRPDMVSGDDVLLQLTARGVDISGAKVAANGVVLDAEFSRDASGRNLAYVSGLSRGTSELEVLLNGESVAAATIIDHPISGPIFSGPHQTPWICDTDDFTLPNGAKLPSSSTPNCEIPTVVQYMYENVEGVIVPLANPEVTPADVRKTTTIDGAVVNFIVRVETGTINRGIYQISMLHDPSVDPSPSPWARSAGWNGRLVYVFGGGCNPGFRQGTTFGYRQLPLHELSRGYAVAASTLNVWGNNCNSVLSAETMSMTKERFIEAYGAPKYTIGKGASGGAKSQLMIADAYPGMLDGIMPASEAGGPDGVTANPATLDCALLVNYFNSRTSLSWSYEQKTAVAGWAGWNNCERQAADDPPEEEASYWYGRFSPNYARASSHRPAQFSGCPAEIDSSLIYDATSNPAGIRCDVYSAQMNIFGRAQGGAPRRPLDNLGIEYGLKAFRAGIITAEQFVELNEKIGGYAADGAFIEERTVADPVGLRIAYRTGQVLSGGGGLSSMPIIDIRRYQDTIPNIHDRLGSFITRERLRIANGDTDNMVLYTFHPSSPAASKFIAQIALSQMTKWLDAIHADTSADSLAVKVKRNKPTGLADACWDVALNKIVEPAAYAGASRCNALFPSFANPRIAAGMPLANDVLKCRLKPIDPAAYDSVLSKKHVDRLRAAHPDGVCDFSRPGVEQQGLAGAWFTFRSPGRPVALDR